MAKTHIFCLIVTIVVCLFFMTISRSRFSSSSNLFREVIISPVQQDKAKEGFVVVLRTSGQQGSGIRALKSLQCWASALPFPVKILEPAFQETTIVSYLPLTRTNISQTLKFSDLFDINHFNKGAKDNHLPEIATATEFYDKAPKRIVIVWRTTNRNKEVRNTWPYKAEKCVITKQLKDQELQKYVSHIPKKLYCIVKVVIYGKKMFGKQIFTSEGITHIYRRLLPSEVTVVFPNWSASFQDHNKKGCYLPSNEFFQPSRSIINLAQLYEKLYLNSSNTLAVMLRLERIVDYLKKHSNDDIDVTKCLDKVISVSQTTRAKYYDTISKPFLTIDVGESGSNSWHGTLGHVNKTYWLTKAEETIYKLSHGEWRTIKDWDESFKQFIREYGIDHPAYLAALQRTIASRANCLVLAGGGNFQSIALKDYQKNHPNQREQCVEFVCVLEEITVN